MQEHLLQRLKALFFLVFCGLGMAALGGWAGFAYQKSASNRLSAQVASVIADRNAIKAQRDAALNNLNRLQQPPGNLAQIDARLTALGTEYNRLWDLAKAKRLQAAGVDSTSTGSIRKPDPPRRVR